MIIGQKKKELLLELRIWVINANSHVILPFVHISSYKYCTVLAYVYASYSLLLFAMAYTLKYNFKSLWRSWLAAMFRLMSRSQSTFCAGLLF